MAYTTVYLITTRIKSPRTIAIYHAGMWVMHDACAYMDDSCQLMLLYHFLFIYSLLPPPIKCLWTHRKGRKKNQKRETHRSINISRKTEKKSSWESREWESIAGNSWWRREERVFLLLLGEEEISSYYFFSLFISFFFSHKSTSHTHIPKLVFAIYPLRNHSLRFLIFSPF